MNRFELYDAIKNFDQGHYSVSIQKFLDNLTQVTDPEGRVTEYAYDADDLLIAEIRTDNAGQPVKRQFKYDANGNLKQMIAPSGDRIVHHYNDVDERTKTEYFSHGRNKASRTVVYQYNDRGQLQRYDDGPLYATYAYNLRGQIKAITTHYGPFSKTLGYEYDEHGYLTHYTNPEGIR